MITSREVSSALYGAYRLARADSAGIGFFDTTLAGFWRSFTAAVLVFPLYLLLLAFRFSSGAVEAGAARFISVEIIVYVMSWVAFPLVMVTISRALGRERHYFRFVTAYNWSAVWQNAIYMPVGIAITAGIITGPAASLAGLGILALVSLYIWFVVKTALDISAAAAAGLVLLDLVLSIFINAVGESML